MNNAFYSSPIDSPLRSSNVHRLHRMHRRSFAVTSISIGVVFGTLMVIAAIAGTWISYGNATTHTGCTINSKDSYASLHSDERRTTYRVYTDNCGVFEVEDRLFLGNFNSADIYGSLKESGTYDLSTRGYRASFLSMFPVIVEATPAR